MPSAQYADPKSGFKQDLRHPLAIPRPSMADTKIFTNEMSVTASDFVREDKQDSLGILETTNAYEHLGVNTKFNLLVKLIDEGASLFELEEVLKTDERFFTKNQLFNFLNPESSLKSKPDYTRYYIQKAITALDFNTSKYKEVFGYSYAITISEAYAIREHIDKNNGRVDSKHNEYRKGDVKCKLLPAVITCIINQKGGASKTTTTQSIAAGIAISEPSAKVLMIDADHQSTLTDYYSINIIDLLDLGEDHPLAEEDISIGDIIACDDPIEAKELVSKAIRTTPIPNLSIIPSRRRDNAVNNIVFETESLSETDRTREFVGRKDSDSLLRRMEDALGHLVYEYDYIFIDLSPQVSNLLSYNSLAFAHSLIIPFSCTRNDIQATTEWLSEFSTQVNLISDIGGYGFVEAPMMLRANFDSQTSQKNIENLMLKSFSKYFFTNRHLHSEAIAAANSERKSIYEVNEAEMTDKTAYKRAIENTDDVVGEVKAHLDSYRVDLQNLAYSQSEPEVQ